MPSYRIIFKEQAKTPVRSITFNGDDPGDALHLAQFHDGPSEVWHDDELLFTLDRTGRDGLIWVISGSQPAGKLPHAAGRT